MKKVENIVDNLLIDSEGSEENLDEVENKRSKNYKQEIARLESEINQSKSDQNQLTDYQEYLNEKISDLDKTNTKATKKLDQKT